VLDLAAGPGGVGHRAAELVVPDGGVLSADLATAMVEAAQRIGAQRGLSNVEYRVMDAQAIDLDDDAVDVIVCRSGFMLMPHPADALREARRALRTGGNLAFSVFAAPERNPFVGVPPSVFIELGHLQPPPPGAPGVFAMSDPSRIGGLLVEAGFQAQAIEAIDLEGPFPNEEVIVDRIFERIPRSVRCIAAWTTTNKRMHAGYSSIASARSGKEMEPSCFPLSVGSTRTLIRPHLTPESAR